MAPSLRQTVQNRISDAIWTSFAEAYQTAQKYYDDDKLDECAKECCDILGEGAVPRYIKISTLILLALVVESEYHFRAARTEAETLYQMTISFHRRGRDEKTDQEFDALRESLDELKEIEQKEFGISTEETAEKDDAAFVKAQSREDEGAFFRELKDGEEVDIDVLRKADEMAMDPANYPVERDSKIRMSEAASAPSKPVLLTQKCEASQQEEQQPER